MNNLSTMINMEEADLFSTPSSSSLLFLLGYTIFINAYAEQLAAMAEMIPNENPIHFLMAK